jgi:hypothetical protein
MSLLSVVFEWIKPTPFPRWEIAEVVGGGPYDGDLFWCIADWADGHETGYEGCRYKLATRVCKGEVKRVLVFRGAGR